MRFARFVADGDSHFGVIDGNEAVSLTESFDSLEAMIGAAPNFAVTGARWPLGQVGLLAPIPAGCKIVCAANNYPSVDHSAVGADEEKTASPARPAHPQIFIRFADSFVGPEQPVLRAPEAPDLDWEGEIGLIVGRPARRVPVVAAMDYVAGFTCIAENSERTWQNHTSQVTGGKNWFRSGAIGPWITSVADTVLPLRLTTRLNGEVVQQTSSDRLVFGFAELVSYISTFTPLRPGDVIATGTPAGVGFRRTPPRYLQPGDNLEVEVSQVGELHNSVQDEA